MRVQHLIAFLTSVRLTVISLGLIIIGSAAGTVIPQHLSQNSYQQLYGPAAARIIQALQLHDTYHSWWFLILAGIFTLNLISCMIKKVPSLISALRQDGSKKTAGDIHRLPHQDTFRLSGDRDAGLKTISSVLSGRISGPSRRDVDAGTLFYAEKGRSSHLGFTITHLGILLIIIGSLAGSYGFRGFMELRENEQSNVVLTGEKEPPYELDFTVRCDRFDVHFYPGTQRPRSYESTLTILENGREKITRIITVNRPLTWKGVTIYQSSYSTLPDTSRLYMAIRQENGREQERFILQLHTPFALQDSPFVLTAEQFIPDFALDSGGRAFSRSAELRNPAVKLHISGGNAPPESRWYFAAHPDFHLSQDGPLPLQFLGVGGTNSTGLQLSRTPGLSLIWIGCILLTGGAFMIFFSSHRQIWVLAGPEKKNISVTVSGRSSRPAAFGSIFNDICTAIKKG